MGKRGPKPKPTAVRIFEGNPGNLPIDKCEPKPAIIGAECPDWLDICGRVKWEEISPRLSAVKLLTGLDLDMLAMYCEAWQEFHAATAVIAKEGMIASSEKGGAYQHPAVGIKNKALQRLKQLGGEFGMSPASRVGLKVAEGPVEDELEQYKKHG